MGARWRVLVDWHHDGTYSDETGRVFHVEYARGATHFIRPDGHGFERPRRGKGKVLLSNTDGRYDALNTASPLYPHVLPGAPMRVEVSADDGATWAVRFVGRVNDLRPMRSRGSKAVEMRIQEDWGALGTRVYSDVLENVWSDEAMTVILDKAGWPNDKRDIAPGLNKMAYWWAEGGTALEEIFKLAEAEYGHVWVSGDGVLHFRNRHAEYTSSVTLDGAVLTPKTTVQQPWDVVRTVVQIPVQVLARVNDVVLYSLMEPLRLNGNSAVTMWVNYTYQNTPARALAITAVNYAANGAADGSGTDYTTDVSVDVTRFAASAKVVITNTTSSVVWLTMLQLKGDALWSSNTQTASSRDAGGIGLYGERVFTLTAPWVEDVYVAQDYADFLLSWWKTPRLYPEVVLRGKHDVQERLDVGTVIDVDLPEEHLSGEHRVFFVDERWLTSDGSLYETKVRLNPRFNFVARFWRFPTTLGVSSVFGF